MSIIVSESEGKSFTPAPSGTHQSVCFGTWDIGWQKTEYLGKQLVQPKVIIGWEINEIMDEGEFAGKRFTIYKTYTASLSEKANLRRDLENWRGKTFTKEELRGFDIEKLYGVNAMLSIVHVTSQKGNIYAKVSSVSKLAKGMLPLLPENPREMPDWIKKKKEESVDNEPKNLSEEEPHTEDEEKIPF